MHLRFERVVIVLPGVTALLPISCLRWLLALSARCGTMGHMGFDTGSGFVDGKHYITYVDTVKRFKREGKLDEAESLLLRLINATEKEASVEGFGVAPWYYEQVAIVRSKRGDLEGELEILRRFAGQQHAPGAGPPKLLLRMRKVEVKLRDA